MLFVLVHLWLQITKLLLATGAYLSQVSGTFTNTARISLSAAKGDKIGRGKTPAPAKEDDDISDEGSTYLEDQVMR
jgi:hypothetical protein